MLKNKRKPYNEYQKLDEGSCTQPATVQTEETELLLQMHQNDLEMQNEELLHTRAELEKELKRLTKIFDFAPVGYFITNNKGFILETNLTAASQLGITQRDIVDNYMYKFIPEQDLNIYFQYLKHLIETETPQTCELRMLKNKSEKFWVRLEASITKDTSGTPKIHIIMSNINELKQLEEALSESEEKHRILLDESADPIFSLTLEGKYKYANRAFAEGVGKPLEDIIDKKIWNVFPKEEADQQYITLRKVFSSGEKSEIEYSIQRPDSKRFYLSTITPIKDTRGDVVSAIGSSKDITKRKMVEDELWKSEAQKNAILNGIPTNIALLDKELNILWANKAAANSVDKQPDEMVGNPCYNFWSDSNQPCINCPAFTAFQSGQSEHKIVQTARGRIWDESGEPLFDAEGNVFAVVEIAQDITERKLAEEELLKSEKNLKETQSIAHFGRWELDLYTNQLQWSDSIFEIFEIDPSQFSASYNAFLQLIHPADRERVNQVYIESVKNRTPYEITHRLLMPDGRLKWVKETCRTEYDLQGQAIRSIGLLQEITEIKRAEESLQESEERFRTIFEQAAVGVALLETKSGRYVRINQKFCDFLGYTKEEMLNLSFQDITFADDVQENRDYNALLITEKVRDFTIEKRYVRKDGEIVWAILTASPLWAAGEKPSDYFHIAVVQDINARKQAEEELKRSEEKHRSLFEAMAQGVVYQNADGIITSANHAAEDILGLSLDQLQGRTSIDARWRAIHEDGTDFPGETHPGPLSLKTGKEIRNVVMGVFHPKEGQYRWININAVPQFHAGEDKPYQNFTTFEDITERKQAESALRESEEKFRSTIHQATEGFFICDENGEIIEWNKAQEEIFGQPHEKMIGTMLWDFQYSILPAEQKNEENYLRIKQAFLNIKKTGDPTWVGRTNEMQINCGNGKMKTVLISTFTIDTQQGTLYGAITSDISERKVIEEKLLQTQKMADLGTLAAGMAHEINSPLQVITGISDSLLKKLSQPQLLEQQNIIDLQNNLTMLSRNGWRIAELIRSLNIYARGDMQEMNEYALNELVHDTLLLIEHQLVSWSHINVIQDLAEDLPTFFCNRNSITQLLINLLVNAKDAMPNGGDITICSGFDAPSQRLILQVSDQGKGIPPEIQSKIFDPFYTTKPIGQGTGLGLSIVMGIVRSHGAEITVDSMTGKGTTFTIFIPLKTPRVERKSLDKELGRFDDSLLF